MARHPRKHSEPKIPPASSGKAAALLTDDRLRRLIENNPAAQAQRSGTVELPAVTDVPRPEELAVDAPLAEPVTGEDVLRILHELRREHASKRDRAAGEPVALGDDVLVDVLGYAHGKLIPFSVRHEQWLEMAPIPALPGFIENLVGMKVGLSAQLAVPLPADYPVASLRGASAAFLVDVHAARELRLPEPGDKAFLAAVGKGNSLEELLDALAEELAQEREEERWVTAQEQVLDQLAVGTKVDIPAALVDEEIRRRWGEQESKVLTLKNFTPAEQQEALEGWLTDVAMRVDVERRLRISLGLKALWERDGWELSAEALSDTMMDVAEAVGLSVEDVEATLRKDKASAKTILDQAVQIFAVRQVMERAKITFAEPAA